MEDVLKMMNCFKDVKFIEVPKVKLKSNEKFLDVWYEENKFDFPEKLFDLIRNKKT